MKHYFIVIIVLGSINCTAQRIDLPAIYTGEDVMSYTRDKAMQVEPIRIKEPGEMKYRLQAMVGRYLTSYCISHDPFSFVKFVATRKDAQTVALEFETIDEHTSNSFTVERVFATATENKEIAHAADTAFAFLRKTGVVGEFEKLNVLRAKNKGSIKAKYTLTDNNNFTGISFYRITETEWDKSTNLSQIVAVEGTPLKETVSIYPNPARDEAYIRVLSKTPRSARVQLLNVQGNVIKEMPVTMVAGANRLSIPVVGLPAGVYSIRVSRSHGLALQAKFIKL